MLAKPETGRLREGPEWAYEYKLDGYRACIGIAADGTTVLTSRNGIDFTDELGGRHGPGEYVDLRAQYQLERPVRMVVPLALDLIGGGTGQQQTIDDGMQRSAAEHVHRGADRLTPSGAVAREALDEPRLGQRGM